MKFRLKADGFLAMQLGTIGWAYRLHGTYAATAHLMTILQAVALVWIGALYHSFRLLFGRPENARLAYLHVLLTAVVAIGLLYTMTFMGAEGAPRRTYPLPVGAEGAIPLLVLGALLAAGQVAFLLQLRSPRGKVEESVGSAILDDRS